MTDPPSHPMRLAMPDASFRLTPQERARIRTGFDVDALERLLAAVVPGVRPEILEDFLIPERGSQDVSLLVRMGDPALQPLLDEVWAPMWELMGPDAIEKETADFPGRELARQRRDAMKKRGAQP